LLLAVEDPVSVDIGPEAVIPETVIEAVEVLPATVEEADAILPVVVAASTGEARAASCGEVIASTSSERANEAEFGSTVTIIISVTAGASVDIVTTAG